MTRITGVLGMANSFIADPANVLRTNGYLIDWDNVPDYYRVGSFQVQLNGAVAGGKNEVQSVTVTGIPTGGTFTLTFGGQTATIAFNASAAAVQAALEALSSIGLGNVRVTGAGPYYVEFINALGLTDVAALTKNNAGLTGGTSPDVTIATPIPGVVAPTTVTVDALTAAVANGHILDFGNGAIVTTTAAAAAGATTLHISGLDRNLADNTAAWYMTTGPKFIKAGTSMGKTTSSDGKMILPRTASNPAIGLLIEDQSFFFHNNSSRSGCGVMEGGAVYENRLPEAIANSGSLPSAIKTELGARFAYRIAENNAPVLAIPTAPTA